MADEIDYEIIGDDMQIVEIELDPGRSRSGRSWGYGIYGTRNSDADQHG